MIYMGSKSRIAKDILKVMQSDIDRTGCFIDMFCGGGNLLQYVNTKYIIANDIDKYAISYLYKLSTSYDWIPKNNQEFTKQDYEIAKTYQSIFQPHLLGHIGYNLSFGGKWFGGFRSDNTGKRDYVAEAYRGAIKQHNNLKGKNISFHNLTYDKAPLSPNCVIYCDIPYKSTTEYKTNFNHDKFYEWCRKVKKENGELCNNVVIYVSEYDMPHDFECVWQKEIKMTMDKKDNSRTAVEKLFKLK